MRILIGGKKDFTGNYVRALEALGAKTVVWLPESVRDSLPGPFHGLLLPGGGDIHPSFFGQIDQGSLSVDARLDVQQFSLFHAFFQAGRPILGICKGMQLINVALGGTLIQDLKEPARTIHAYDRADRIHPTAILPGTFLHSLYGNSLITNSAHHQAVDCLGRDLLPAQYGSEHVLVGLYHKTSPVLGVQWLPERMCGAKKNPEAGDGSQVLRYFLSLCVH